MVPKAALHHSRIPQKRSQNRRIRCVILTVLDAEKATDQIKSKRIANGKCYQPVKAHQKKKSFSVQHLSFIK